MARKGPPEQAKHFKHDDHEHAAHQQEAAHEHAQEGLADAKAGARKQKGKARYPGSTTPRGPSRGQ